MMSDEPKMQLIRWSCLATAMAVLLVAPGCLVVAGDSTDEQQECWTECEETTRCEPYCDAYSCYDECWQEETCETVCDSESYYPDESEYFDEPDRCYSDLQCDGGRICIGNKCQAPSTEDRGGAGLCQACESRHDCVEEGALCLGFVDDGGDGNIHETACGRACTSDTDCPGGFECFTVEDSNQTVEQCVPTAADDGTRTCSATDDLECVTAADCDTAESCVNNSCEPPENAECTGDGDCGSDERCEVFECVDDDGTGGGGGEECITASDCTGDDDICVDGQCVDEGGNGGSGGNGGGAESCVFNADCPSDERCVDGECTATCDGNDDCGLNEYCREGICEYIECQQTADCTPGEVCVEARCTAACDVDDDCSFGFLCTDIGYCDPDPNVECRSSAECAGDEGCSFAGTCEASCTCNDECSGGDICHEETGVCEEPLQGETGLEC